MAIEKTIKLNVETGAAQKNTEDLTNVLKEQRAILIELEREYLEASRVLNETSKSDFSGRKKATEQVKHLRDSIKDQRLSVRELSNEQSNLNKASADTTKHHIEQGKALELLDKVTGGYLTESIHLYEKASRGVTAIGPAFTKMGKAGKTALTGIKTGIAATGIGLLVIALGAIYAYWDDIIGAVSGVSVEQENLNNLTAHNLTVEKDKYNALSLQDNALRLQGKSEKEILQIKKKQIDAVILAAEAQLQSQYETKKAQIDAAKRNKDIAQGIIRFMMAPITMLLAAVDSLTAGLAYIGVLDKGTDFEGEFSGGLANMIFDPKETAEDIDATIKQNKEALNKLRSDRDGFELSIEAFDAKQVQSNTNKNNSIAKNDKQVGDDKLAAEKKAAEEANKFKKEAETEFLNQIEAIQEKNWQNTLTQQEREEQAIAAKYFALEQMAKGNAEQLAIIETAKNAELKVITDKHEKEKTAKEKADKALKDEFTLSEDALAIQKIKDDYAIKAALAKDDADLIVLINEERDKKIIAIEEAAAKKKKEIQIQGVADGLSVISSLTELFAGKSQAQQKKAFKIQKAANIAAATIDTFKGAQSAYASQIIPLDPTSVVRGAIAAGVVIAAGLANIKKIASTQFSGDSVTAPTPSDAGGSGSGGAITPQFNVVGNSGINQLAQIQQQPTQAYVVSGAVTSAQSLDRNRIQNATIG
jgi:hypothetical protein